MNATEAARQIREGLKAAGIPARAVSVRSESYSMGSSVYVRIKDTTAACFATVEAIATAHERVRRDGYGEILGGGNMYVSVDVDHDAIVESHAEHVDGATWRYLGHQIRQTDRGFEIDSTAPVFGRPHCALTAAMRAIYCERKPALAAGPVDSFLLSDIFGD